MTGVPLTSFVHSQSFSNLAELCSVSCLFMEIGDRRYSEMIRSLNEHERHSSIHCDMCPYLTSHGLWLDCVVKEKELIPRSFSFRARLTSSADNEVTETDKSGGQ